MSRRMRGSETVLPATSRLIGDLRRAGTGAELAQNSGGQSDTLSYRVCVAPGEPFVQFVVTRADAGLLRLVRQDVAGFEVLSARCAGLQYHWRSDLVRAVSGMAPLVGRLSAMTERREFLMEHLMLPVLARGQVAEVHGWFTFQEEGDPEFGLPDRDEVQLIRRSLRVRPARLPRRFMSIELKDSAILRLRRALGRCRPPWLL